MEIRAADARSQTEKQNKKRCGCMIIIFTILAVGASVLSFTLQSNNKNNSNSISSSSNMNSNMEPGGEDRPYYLDQGVSSVVENPDEDHNVGERQRERPEPEVNESNTEDAYDEESEEELEYESVIDEADSLDTNSDSIDEDPESNFDLELKQYNVLTSFQHDPKSFTQGLTFANGVLYESTGLYKKSKVRKLDPKTGEVLQTVDMDDSYFGEGMAYISGSNTLLQITWKEQTAFVYDADTLEELDQFTYSTQTSEGWGITHMPERNELAVSDGSEYLHFWSAAAPYKELRRIAVVDENGEGIKRINELEYVNGWIFANIWQKDIVLQIDPANGRVVKTLDFTDLWPKQIRDRGADVLNGISIMNESDAIDGTLSGNQDGSVMVYMTGKLWPDIYIVELLNVVPRDLASDQLTVEIPDFGAHGTPGDTAAPVCDPDKCYEVLGTMDHDNTSFTQGLTYFGGTLYESTGIKGASKVRTLDPETGVVLESFDLDKSYFGEGMTFLDVEGDNPELVQLTWKARTGIVYDAATLAEKRKFEYSTSTTEGWGITYIPEAKELVVSDGSEWIHFWDATAENFPELRRLQVTNQTDTDYIRHINELEYVNGTIFANIWYQNYIIVIDPETAKVIKTYNFEQLWPMGERGGADCLNGISVTEKADELLLTGKWWPKIYRVRLLDT